MKPWCAAYVLCLGLAACASDGELMTDGSFDPDNSMACRLAATEREMPPVYDEKGRNLTPYITSNRDACKQEEWSWYQRRQRDKQRDEYIDFSPRKGDRND